MSDRRQSAVARSAAMLAGAGLLLSSVGAASTAAAAPTDVFISEYVEASFAGTTGRALELYNGTGASVNLGAGGYTIDYYTNGSPAASGTIALTGSVATGDVYILSFTLSSALVLSLADQQSGLLTFNGNDALVLRKGATVVDSIGQIGFDPGAAGWGVDPVKTDNSDLFRKATVTSGDTNPSDVFDPALEWSAFPFGTSGLGAHTIDPSGGGGGGGEPADTGQVAADVTLEAETACIELSTTAISFGTLGFAVEAARATPDVTITNCSTGEIQVNASATDATGTDASWTLVNDGSTCGGSPDLGTDQYRLGIGGPDFVDGPVALDKQETTVAGLAAGDSATHTPQIWMPCPGSAGNGQRLTFSINYLAVAP